MFWGRSHVLDILSMTVRVPAINTGTAGRVSCFHCHPWSSCRRRLSKGFCRDRYDYLRWFETKRVQMSQWGRVDCGEWRRKIFLSLSLPRARLSFEFSRPFHDRDWWGCTIWNARHISRKCLACKQKLQNVSSFAVSWLFFSPQKLIQYQHLASSLQRRHMHFHAGDSPSSPLDSLLFLPSSHLPLVARANLHAQERDETWARAAYTSCHGPTLTAAISAPCLARAGSRSCVTSHPHAQLDTAHPWLLILSSSETSKRTGARSRLETTITLDTMRGEIEIVQAENRFPFIFFFAVVLNTYWWRLASFSIGPWLSCCCLGTRGQNKVRHDHAGKKKAWY